MAIKVWTLLVYFFLVIMNQSLAQHRRVDITIGAGHAFLGTGDISGFTFFNEVELPLTKRLSVNPGLQFTNHSKSYNFTNYKYRYITTGVAIYTNLNYALLLRPRHRIAIGIGPSLRYQSTSDPSNIDVTLAPSGTPILNFDYDEPMTTWAVGYIIAPQYQFQVSRKFFLGARLMLQNDTRGDVITSQVLMFGIHL